jgi:uncharacterized YigZ family protein
MSVTSFKSVKLAAAGEYREKGSRFLAEIFPVSSEQEVKDLVSKARKLHPKAVHHCYAYRLGADMKIFRFSDDREPSGSAGRPIFSSIQNAGLTNVLIIVVRYFGGTQLGIPGLINAYKTAADAAVNSAEVIEVKVMLTWEVEFPLDLTDAVMKFMKRNGGRILHYTSSDNEVLECELGVEESAEMQKVFLNEFPFAERVTLKSK